MNIKEIMVEVNRRMKSNGKIGSESDLSIEFERYVDRNYSEDVLSQSDASDIYMNVLLPAFNKGKIKTTGDMMDLVSKSI